MPRHCMAHDALAQREPQQGESQFPLKTPCEKIEPLKNAVRLRRAQASSSHHTPAATMNNERNNALITLAVLARYRRYAGGSVVVRACMVCIPTTWRDRVALSQVVDEQQLTDTSNLCHYNSWTATVGHGTYRSAMVCSALSRVSRESDR